MQKLNLLKSTITSIDNQLISKNNSSFKINLYSHYLFKSINLKSPIKFPASKFKYQNIVLNTRQNTIDFWACLESYEPDLTYFLINVLKNSKGTFIDVGGHIGRFSVLMAKNDWDVISFEPIKSNYEMILKNLKENECFNKAEVFNLGLGESNHKQIIYFNSSELGESSLLYSDDKKEQTEIEIVKFDNLLNDRDFKEPCVVKIDVEGNEANVINGMKEFIKNQQPIIILELWEDNSENITSFLRENGYKRIHIFWFINGKHDEFKDKMYNLYNKHSIRYEYK